MQNKNAAEPAEARQTITRQSTQKGPADSQTGSSWLHGEDHNCSDWNRIG